MISAEVVISSHFRWIDRLDCGIASAYRTVEGALDQALRTQSRGIIGIQFRSALGAVWHLNTAAAILCLRPEGCNFDSRVSLFVAGEPDLQTAA